MSEEYTEGCAAFTDGQPLAHNPYPLGTPEHSRWRGGWIDGRQEAREVEEALALRSDCQEM